MTVAESELLDAVEKGDAKKVLYWVKAGVNPSKIRELNGSSALHIAAKNGRAKMVKLLLDLNCDPNAKNNVGLLPLTEAVQLGKHKAASLLAPVSDLTHTLLSHPSALSIAAKRNDKRMVNLLINAGADIKATTRDGDCAFAAAKKGSLEVLKFLLEQGAGTGTNEYGQNIVCAAASEGQDASIEMILDFHKDFQFNLGNNKANDLHIIASSCKYETIKKCLDRLRPADYAHLVDNHGRNLLHRTAWAWSNKKDPRTVALLINAGVDLNHADNEGFTPLELAKERSEESCLLEGMCLAEAQKLQTAAAGFQKKTPKPAL